MTFGLVLVAVVGGVVGLLCWLASRHPLLAFSIGAALLAVPIAQWITFDPRYFRTEGSAGGLVIFAVYAFIGLGSGLLGLVFVGAGVLGALGRWSARPRMSWRKAAAIVCGAVVLTAGAWFYAFPLQDWREARAIAAYRASLTHQKSVQVADTYGLAWAPSFGAPALRLTVPLADLDGRGHQDIMIQETGDGPRELRLVLLVPDEAGKAAVVKAELALERDVFAFSELPYAFWVQRRRGAWTFLGIDCTRTPLWTEQCHAPQELARRLPWLFGLQRVPFLVALERSPERCAIIFPYEGRTARGVIDGSCRAPAARRALMAAVDVLGRLSADTRSPPPLDVRLARATKAVERCEAATRSTERAIEEAVCTYAVRASAADLDAAPSAAGELVTRVLLAKVVWGSALHYGRPYAEKLFATLMQRGTPQSKDTLRAHAVRLAYGGIGTPEEVARQRDESLEAASRLAPQLLEAQDRLFDQLVGAARSSQAHAAEPYFALLAAWHDKANAASPGSDAAQKARFALCYAQLQAQRQRETHRQCADQLFQAWESRAASNSAFDPFFDEAMLAVTIGRLYLSYGYGTQDWPNAASGVRRAAAFAQKRLPPLEPMEELVRAADKMDPQPAKPGAG